MVYTTLENVEAMLSETFDSTTAPTDTQVNTFISWASAEIDKRTGTKFEPTTVTDEIYDYLTSNTDVIDADFPNSLAQTRHDFGTKYHNNLLFLKNAPLISVTSVYRNTNNPVSGSDDWELLTSGSGNDYLVYDEYYGKILFLNNYPYAQVRSLKITYVYGYSAVPEEVSELATLLVAKQIINSKVANSSYDSSDSITVGAISITKSSGQNVGFLNYLNSEIDRLWNLLDVYRVSVI